MRRKDRQTDEAEAWRIVDSADYAVLSLTDADGKPYCVPVSPARLGNVIFFHGANEGKKKSILSVNSFVCLSFVGRAELRPTEYTESYESATVFGKAELLSDDNEKEAALRLIAKKYAPENPDNFTKVCSEYLFRTDVWRIAVSEITGKVNK